MNVPSPFGNLCAPHLHLENSDTNIKYLEMINIPIAKVHAIKIAQLSVASRKDAEDESQVADSEEDEVNSTPKKKPSETGVEWTQAWEAKLSAMGAIRWDISPDTVLIEDVVSVEEMDTVQIPGELTGAK